MWTFINTFEVFTKVFVQHIFHNVKWNHHISDKTSPEMCLTAWYWWRIFRDLDNDLLCRVRKVCIHYNNVIMSSVASQITSLTIAYSTVYSRADQRKHQSSASLAFVWRIHRWPMNSPHKWPVTRKMFPFDDVILKPHQTNHERVCDKCIFLYKLS